ncbi:RES domain protein [Legionella massiliensis]|uniref:RES domain protein n=1 Tax=Legionella massiliensis TaxID=1034943 RepID=A0A078KYH3_9GAMM|nr:RES family NAD+ phosphorylase [Legionella massiliensis]CDZ76829.1 RES domain protein [Legionella massiliensis]CEE12567.1 RES domain protein [Legionella massiliensis]
MVDIWLKSEGKNHIKPLMAKIYRLVESQEQIATLGLVNDVYEQGVLEELIESTKTPLPTDTSSLHYLLTTPFRYPPLKYGSRFGTTFEQGMFYGSLNISTALSETAYYRFVYMLGPETPYAHPISNQYTSFSVKVRSDKGIFLDQAPFSRYELVLTSPSSYIETQQLGTNMRESGVEIFQFISARDKDKGKNIALFTPKAFQSKAPAQMTTWLCQTSIEEVGFMAKETQQRTSYVQKNFWVDNSFPSPAT